MCTRGTPSRINSPQVGQWGALVDDETDARALGDPQEERLLAWTSARAKAEGEPPFTLHPLRGRPTVPLSHLPAVDFLVVPHPRSRSRSRPIPVSGAVHLFARAAKGRASWDWRYAFFRYRTVPKEGVSDWSQVVLPLVE